MASLPRFNPPPNQLAPKFGHAANEDVRFQGATVKLSGVFGTGPASVQVSGVAAAIVGRGPSRIDVLVPEVPPGNHHFTVTTAGGSVVSDDAFTVAEFPVLLGLDPLGFSRDPSNEGIVIAVSGEHLRMTTDERQPRATCVLTPRFNPDEQTASTSVPMEVAGFDDTALRVRVPAIPEFDRFVGGTGFILIDFADGVTLETETWEIEGL